MPRLTDNPFLASALAEAPRLLGQLNRNPGSATYGSFDRAFWHYRTNDISCARYQEAAYTLALLYAKDFPGNAYYRSPLMLEWVEAALAFTLTLQHRDGSFDEWYRNERSFVATAFLTAALSETLLLLPEGALRGRAEALRMLERSAAWLSPRREEAAMNQTAGAALALLNVATLTGSERLRQDAEEKLAFLLASQNGEGWWSEYGGPDAGYLSLTLDYLARYGARTPREDLSRALARAARFLVHVLHPDFTAGGEYLARNTEYLIPSGLALQSAQDAAARFAFSFSREALSRGAGITPAALDDRYLCYMLSNWLVAGLGNAEPLPDVGRELAARRLDVFFPDAGLRVMQNDAYYFVANFRKGGSFRLYALRGGRYLDSGIECEAGRRSYAPSFDPRRALARDRASGKLALIREPLMRTPTLLLFKSFTWAAGALFPAAFVKRILRRRMITEPSAGAIPFERAFELLPERVTVHDCVGAALPRRALRLGVKASYAFIPSAKFAAAEDVAGAALTPAETEDETNRDVAVTRTFNLPR